MNMNEKVLSERLKKEKLSDIINDYINIVESELKNNSNQNIEFNDIYDRVKDIFSFLNKYSDSKTLNICLNKKECEYVINDFNKALNTPVKTIEELEDIMSEEFENYLRYSEDAQDAYDNMCDCEYDGLMKKYAFVYSLSGKGETWSIGIGEDFDYSKEDYYLNIFSEIYDEDFEDIDDITSKLENEVMKIMSNCGCDVFNAFNLIVEEDFPEEIGDSVFVIDNADGTPSIELFQIV